MNNQSEPDLNNPTKPQEIPVLQSRELFGDRNEIQINHEGVFYRLKITRQGKLILNK